MTLEQAIQMIELLSNIKDIMIAILVFMVAYACYLGIKEFSHWICDIFRY